MFETISRGLQASFEAINELAREIRIVLFATGCKDLAALRELPLIHAD